MTRAISPLPTIRTRCGATPRLRIPAKVSDTATLNPTIMTIDNAHAARMTDRLKKNSRSKKELMARVPIVPIETATNIRWSSSTREILRRNT